MIPGRRRGYNHKTALQRRRRADNDGTLRAYATNYWRGVAAMDPNELVIVYTAANSVQAEIVKNALEAEGIPAFVENENQAGEVGLTGIDVRAEVAAKDAERARTFIEAHEPHRRHHHHRHHHHRHPPAGDEQPPPPAQA